MFKILLFPDSIPRTPRKCLGVLGYVLKERRNKFNITFVPSKFIQPISRKTKINLIELLIEGGYIQRIKPYEGDKTWWDKIREQTEAYKMEPNFYQLKPKLLNLRIGELIDPSIEKVVINNLHHLHQQHFNHWAHSFRHIKLDVPDEAWSTVINSDQIVREIWQGKSERSITLNLRFIAEKFGDQDFKLYTENRVFGYQDPTGRYHSIFTRANPILRQYTSLNEPASIGIRYSEGVIMADQLLRVFGNNDFSKYFIDDAIAYQEKVTEAIRKESDPPQPRNLMLYEPPDDILIHFDPSPSPISNYEIGRETIYYAMFHYWRNDFFEETFPQTWDLLYKIKANKRGEHEHYNKYMFEEFVKDIKPWISLNDKRIQVIMDFPS